MAPAASSLSPALQIDGREDVAVALVPLERATQVQVAGLSIELREPIPVGHKFALRTIPERATITEFTQFTLSAEHDFGDRVRLRGFAGWAESDHTNPVQTTLLFDVSNIDGYSYDYRDDDRLPLITYGTIDVVGPDTWTLTQIRLRPQTAKNTYETLEADLAFDVSDAVTLKGGVQFKQYEVETTEQRRSNGSTSNQEGSIPDEIAATPTADYSQVVSIDGLGAPSGTTLRWLVPDVRTAGSLFSLYDRSDFPMGIEPSLGNNQTVEEEDLGIFAQLDFRFDVAGMPLRGNLGVRYVETDLTSTGYTFSGGTPVLITANHDYDNTLPSMNVVLEVTDEFLVRFAAAQVMTRPNLGNLAPSTTISVSGNNRTVNTGNPTLEPFEADAFDLAFEWYFAEESLLSLALFYKDIGSFVSTSRESRPFTGNPYGLPDELALAACGTVDGCSPDADWVFSIPNNTPGGDLQGFEISYQQPFTGLPGILSNFGVILNYTGVESEVEYLNATARLLLRPT